MKIANKVVVFFGEEEVGTIAKMNNNATAFQYSSSWINNGFSISPLSLPLNSNIFYAKREPFDGLFGVFNDSLPDGWGRLVTDRYLKSHGINPSELTPLDRLLILNEERTGSLRYEPAEKSYNIYSSFPDLDKLCTETKELLNDKNSDGFIDEFFIRGSSSNGARPKINLRLDGEEWIVKFPSIYDGKDMGEMEYSYNKAAEKCNIEVAEFRLLESRISKGFFASRRFDRPLDSFHMVSVSGLLETDHRAPALDYSHIFKLSWLLSKDVKELERLYSLMCFNVFSHNQDDHSKNFSFLYDIAEDKWKLSPAYDLTFSSTLWNEESTTVNGKGKNIGTEDLVKVGKMFSIDEAYLISRANEIKEIVAAELGRYLS